MLAVEGVPEVDVPPDEDVVPEVEPPEATVVPEPLVEDVLVEEVLVDPEVAPPDDPDVVPPELATVPPEDCAPAAVQPAIAAVPLNLPVLSHVAAPS